MSLGNYINSSHLNLHSDIHDTLHVNGNLPLFRRSRTPNNPSVASSAPLPGHTAEPEPSIEDDPRVARFRGLYAQSEARLVTLFGEKHETTADGRPDGVEQQGETGQGAPGQGRVENAAPPKKPIRTIDEDDYDDYDDDEEEDDTGNSSPPKSKSTGPPSIPNVPSPVKILLPSSSSSTGAKGAASQGKTSEDVRKKLEEDKKAAEDAAKRSFHTLFYTLENDRDAMVEQQKLEESDRQVDVELSGQGNSGTSAHNAVAGTAQQGTLSQANLGASSLTLKHLIARIDAKRELVRASDAELRSLMSEVRKNRSKWASEEKVGQEELYEAAEKVLSELKAMTEHSNAFLTRVNKREAPDYYNVIKNPMDLGTMTKKLKAVTYKSKQEFVDDLNLIWANCLKYNANPEHFLRKHALYMRKETEKLVPLIPEIVIRDRADVEAEERRMQNGDGDIDGGEESDDEPIMSSRGRKAPGKKAKKGSNARKAPAGALEGTPGAEPKPMLNGLVASGRPDFLKADSDIAMDGSQNGLSSPPPGTLTPAGVNGVLGSVPPDGIEADGFTSSVNGASGGWGHGEVEHDDLEYKTWKQVTKKDRALVAAERNRLFKNNRLDPEEPALLRTRAGMRRWMRKQKQAVADGVSGDQKANLDVRDGEEAIQSGETLAEGMEGDEERVLPDYYDTLAAIPELSDRLRWVEDAEGQVQDPSEEFLRIVPKGYFTSPESSLTKKMEGNMRQMQETRKICTKIGVVKQMQLQSQMYQNQFQKYDPEPFVEQDIEPHVISDEGPVMSPWVCRAAMQRSVSKIFYHAGFEEFQPSALEAMTDIAGDFFTKLARTLSVFMQVPETATKTTVPGTSGGTETVWKNKFSTEETILHCLHENGVDVEALESYVKDDVERLGGKLGVMHDRMKAHLADLLRPALTDAGPDGVNAFNDGSEQFVGGDFAEDLDEDFFGFKELGLDKEFGLASLSVPLHLLQNRMHIAYQAQNTSTASNLPTSLTPPPLYAPLTLQSLKSQIGLVQNFFLAKLHANNDQALIEDDDLPAKQRFPKPRLPPNGKISSPRKRPLREPGPGKGHARKRMKLADGEDAAAGGKDGAKAVGKPAGKAKLAAPGAAAGKDSNGNGNAGGAVPDGVPEPEKEDRLPAAADGAGGKDASVVGKVGPLVAKPGGRLKLAPAGVGAGALEAGKGAEADGVGLGQGQGQGQGQGEAPETPESLEAS